MFTIIDSECKSITNNIDFAQLQNKKILVTGASGLIGIYVTKCLLLLKQKLNLDIYCWVNSDLEFPFNIFFEDCKIIKGDITSDELLNSFKNDHENNKFDLIIHCAGYGQPNKFLINKVKTISINTKCVDSLFSVLNLNGKFAFFSTSEIYSGNDKDKITELDCGHTMPDHPRSSYIESKRCGEAICNSYAESYKELTVRILRLSLAYGPGTKKNDQRVLNSLIFKGLNNEQITLLDSGSAIRTYGYCYDIIEMFWNIILFGKDPVYNLAGISKTSILELANNIGQKLNKKVVSTNSSGLVGSPKNVNLSLDRYLNEFNKKTFIDLDTGLENTIRWQKDLYGF